MRYQVIQAVQMPRNFILCRLVRSQPKSDGGTGLWQEGMEALLSLESRLMANYALYPTGGTDD